MTGEIDRGPTETSTGIAFGSLGVASLAAGLGQPLVFGFGAVAFVALALSYRYGSRGLLTVGVAVLFAGELLAGALGGRPLPLLLAVAATVVAYDCMENAISMGEQLGREADTERAELAHAAGSGTVAVLSVGVPFAAFSLAGGGKPASLLVIMLLAAVILTSVLRP